MDRLGLVGFDVVDVYLGRYGLDRLVVVGRRVVDRLLDRLVVVRFVVVRRLVEGIVVVRLVVVRRWLERWTLVD
jgi:hypothetical protein